MMQYAPVVYVNNTDGGIAYCDFLEQSLRIIFFTVIWQSGQAIAGIFPQSADAPTVRFWTMIWEA